MEDLVEGNDNDLLEYYQPKRIPHDQWETFAQQSDIEEQPIDELIRRTLEGKTL